MSKSGFRTALTRGITRSLLAAWQKADEPTRQRDGLRLLNELTALLREQQSELMLAGLLIYHADLLAKSGDISATDACWKEQEMLARKLDRRDLLAAGLGKQAIHHAAREEYSEAQRLSAECADIYSALGNEEMTAESQKMQRKYTLALAVNSSQAKDFITAIQHARELEKLAQRDHDRSDATEALSLQLISERSLQNLTAAMRICERMDEFWDDMQPLQQAFHLNDKGGLLGMLGRPSEGLPLAVQSLEIAGRLGNPALSSALQKVVVALESAIKGQNESKAEDW